MGTPRGPSCTGTSEREWRRESSLRPGRISPLWRRITKRSAWTPPPMMMNKGRTTKPSGGHHGEGHYSVVEAYENSIYQKSFLRNISIVFEISVQFVLDVLK